MAPRLIVVLAVLLLTGCFSPKDSPPASQTTTSSANSETPSSSSSSSTAPVGLSIALSLGLDDCTAWQAPMLFPGTTGPGEPPRGWEPAPETTDGTGVGMYGYRCNRFALAPFERGPVTIVLDTHNKATFPEECVQSNDDSTTATVLNALIVDDSELGQFLNVTYGMPVFVAEMAVSQAQDPPAIHAWTWAVGGQTPSELTIVEDGVTQDPPETSDRLYWAKGTGIGTLSLKFHRTAPLLLENRLGEGTLQPPMLLSQVAGGHYAGPAEWFSSLRADGVFQFYNDPHCKEPKGEP